MCHSCDTHGKEGKRKHTRKALGGGGHGVPRRKRKDFEELKGGRSFSLNGGEKRNPCSDRPVEKERSTDFKRRKEERGQRFCG